jgi:hypothetical protein
MISPQIHHDFHQEIAYDVHNSLYNMIGYFSYQKIAASGAVKHQDQICHVHCSIFCSHPATMIVIPSSFWLILMSP